MQEKQALSGAVSSWYPRSVPGGPITAVTCGECVRPFTRGPFTGEDLAYETEVPITVARQRGVHTRFLPRDVATFGTDAGMATEKGPADIS